MPLLRDLLTDLAPARPGPPVPDLGPAVVVDQLAVLVWDAYVAGRGDGIPELLVAARRDAGLTAPPTGTVPHPPADDLALRTRDHRPADGATFRAWPTAMLDLGAPILTW